MSKMGISTVASYRGAQVFEAIGLSHELVDRYFTGTTSVGRGRASRRDRRRGGIPPSDGLPRVRRLRRTVRWRSVGSTSGAGGEPHLFDPETVFRLQHSTRAKRYDIFKQYTSKIDDQSTKLMTLRGLFDFLRTVPGAAVGGRADLRDRPTVLHRGHVHGSISGEAHETLAIAMNRLGRSRTPVRAGGSGTLQPDVQRRPEAVGDQAGRLGRFGVTSEYLVNAGRHPDQDGPGAKPGEGGQLPATRCIRGSRRPDTRRRAWA